MDSEYKIDLENLPTHIGIIMDGNGRWAQNKKKNRSFGHFEGSKAAKRIVKYASEIGLKHITLYVFSTENWKRNQNEISFLMKLIRNHLSKEYKFYKENKVKVNHIGNISDLPPKVQSEIKKVHSDTESFTGLNLNLAINYGGRDEICRAVNKWKASNPEETFTENILKSNLDFPEMPDADLIIRTAGEKRTSNFLLWQSAYSEFYFTKKLWPDWDKEDLKEAIYEYQKRNRKFGGYTK